MKTRSGEAASRSDVASGPAQREVHAGDEPCRICPSNAGVHRISPGQPIFAGKSWRLEHAYPSALPGWLVIVLERHAEALHELSPAEAEELGRLQLAVARALRFEFDCVKEYSLSLGEGPGFGHLHFHMIPRARDHRAEALGARVFQFLNALADELVSPERVTELCRRLADRLSKVMRDMRGESAQQASDTLPGTG